MRATFSLFIRSLGDLKMPKTGSDLLAIGKEGERGTQRKSGFQQRKLKTDQEQEGSDPEDAIQDQD